MNSELIYAYVYEPSKSPFADSRKDKAKCTTVNCSNSKNCGLFKRGQCNLLTPTMGFKSCPYGKKNHSTGFTQRSRNYYSWITKRKEQYKDISNKLKGASSILTVVGEHVFLSYPHMNMNEEVPFLSHGAAFVDGSEFMLLKDFTVETIINICKFVPQALMGGSIDTYQSKVIPIFIKHLSEQMPELFKEVAKKYDRAREVVENYSHIGREAYLHTITPNMGELVDIHKAMWIWDGEYLTSKNSHASFMLVNKFSEIRIKPENQCKIKITNNDQVNENTEFIN